MNPRTARELRLTDSTFFHPRNVSSFRRADLETDLFCYLTKSFLKNIEIINMVKGRCKETFTKGVSSVSKSVLRHARKERLLNRN